jgi:AraC family transcriptional regulator, transcriptional activator of pobA
MSNIETLEEFYKRKFDWIPDNIKNDIGHFNIFRLEPFSDNIQPVPYKRRDFYKVILIKGNSKVHYADKVIEINKQALAFSNPQIPYKWEHCDNIRSGAYCIFNQQFFHQYGNLSNYSVFQPGGNHVFELTDDQFEKLVPLYEKMFDEISSDYIHKYDVIRTLIFEILHFAMKMQPSESLSKKQANASQRISALFMELLERQFPIDDNHQKMNLRTASDFAEQLNIHVNHLNRSVKETTEKTTTGIIASRIVQESKILLKHSTWSVSDIAFALGFNELTHFNNFFKKHVMISPLKFRKVN